MSGTKSDTGAGMVTTPLPVSFKNAASPKRERTERRRKSIPVTLRLTEAEREKLEDMAAGMTLSAYIRACLFAEEERRRARRPGSVVEDKKAVAEALGLLGQSRIANNLNQLARQANVGTLVIEERERAKIEEAYGYVLSLRTLLVAALGRER
ncbi:MobC family plasmid mobilization relaxosome protein [Mesorhizobium sp. J428]|uniref:MobC family plasmid mobilization relaxosome protein n=1 Tax=Mesorhizobium sp. J428 TaxID=2898440 RepID=UPI002151C3FE|nr:MobC family plasmid mobilization relaxosome protein [Mesorhizobium sp. J428]MCR5858296.1 MobC family plasmid mobilization relaxosome protein [Mesorhizobium sp. J428]